MNKSELGQSLQEEIRISPLKSVLYFIRVPIPLTTFLYFSSIYLRNNPEYISIGQQYLGLMIEHYFWLFLLFLLPLLLVAKDFIALIINGFFNVIHENIFPTYLKTYKKGLILRGYGYIPNIKIKDIRYIISSVTITLEAKDYIRPSIIKRCLYIKSLKIKKHKNGYYILKVHLPYSKLNLRPQEIQSSLPLIKDEAYQPEMTYTVEQVIRQRYSLANPE
tara:strand:- start:581 stop:1240 length:660 start_codon:yes stop_codon:yes gene_type:complete